MSNAKKKPDYPAPFSIRLTPEERQQLDRDAGSRPLSVYVRSRLFEGNASKRKTKNSRPTKDYHLLAQLLGQLGASRLSSNLNQLAKAANMGSLDVTPETEQSLQKAYEQIRLMRQTLFTALGLE